MADIFISYSRNDSEQALALAEQLRANGLDVWIDQHGIEGATSWSKEIANALQACHTMLLLLSPTAVASKNVAKELSVATQLNKHIVPVQVVRTTLEGEFLYHLSALQRVKIADVDAILRAIAGTAQDRPVRHAPKPIDERKSLMILPFKDLSPTADNGWFADGMVSELIDSLSHIKSLRLVDKQTTNEYKTYQGHLADYAREMGIRFFVQGDVRKFGDQIKISCTLLDIDTADHLWQISHKGTMSDIFDMQEELARKVVDGLKLHLLASEEKKLSSRGTSNAEAYEMYLKAEEFYDKDTKVSVEYAMKAIERSLELDPDFPQAMLRRAIILVRYQHGFGGSAEMLDEAEALFERAKKKLSPSDDWRVLAGPGILAMARGNFALAESIARENVSIDPNDYYRHNALAYCLFLQGRYEEVLVEHEACLAIVPESYKCARQIVMMAWNMDRPDLKADYARRFIHLFRRRMQLMPNDDEASVLYGLLLFYLGRRDDALSHLDTISDDHITDELSFRILACLAALLGRPERAIRSMQLSAEMDLNEWHLALLNKSELDSLRDREDFRRLAEAWKARLTSNG
ncbi:MAG: TIR domain-containing protein [Bacteroidetes bacterium]|nr:TIR domain-containing protein [Bacteroidota bacterium]